MMNIEESPAFKIAFLPLAVVTASELNTYRSNLSSILIVLEAEPDIRIHNLSAV